MSNSNKKNEEKIPIFQSIYCAILFTLIIFRIALKNVGLYINLANYISMVVSIAFVFNASVPKIHPEWRRNLCKSIFLLILLALIIAGFCVLVLNIDIPSILNDIFTLIPKHLSSRIWKANTDTIQNIHTGHPIHWNCWITSEIPARFQKTKLSLSITKQINHCHTQGVCHPQARFYTSSQGSLPWKHPEAYAVCRLLIYSVSSLTTSSKSVMSLRPLTCHIPVIPGLIAIRAL